MEHPHKPMDAIKAWQNRYKEHRIVAEMNEPLVTKDSRENLHDTSKATDVFTDWRSWYKEMASEPNQQTQEELIKKATDYFADTIAEFLPELGGKTLYQCFVSAAAKSMMHAETEYDKNKELIDLLSKKKKWNPTDTHSGYVPTVAKVMVSGTPKVITQDQLIGLLLITLVIVKYV